MKISIVTINYNNLSGLKKTRESIVSQTCNDYEWIVIDGGSTDGAKEFLQEHADEMAYWCSEKDKGVYNAQNKGIALAKGDYIICMNSGDTFHDENVLQNVCSQDLTADVVYGDWMRVYPDGREEKKEAPKEISPYFFYYDNICHQAMFVKTSVMQVNPFDETYKIYADWSKWRELYQRGCTFEYVPVMVCDYEVNGGLSEAFGETNALEFHRMDGELPEGLKKLRQPFVEEIENLKNNLDNERQSLWKAQEDYKHMDEVYRQKQEEDRNYIEKQQELIRQQQSHIDVLQPVYDNKYSLLTYKLVNRNKIFQNLISLNLKLLKLFTKIR